MEMTLREIASVVEMSLIIDNATIKHIFGQYARVFVDMDFSRKLFHDIVVERDGLSFSLNVAYEWLPDFCSNRQNIGHNVTSCCWLYPQNDNKVVKENVANGKKQVPVRKLD